MVRILGIVVVLLSLVPVMPASAVVSVGDPPMHFVGDASLITLPGKGTAEDPYVIERKMFVLQGGTSSEAEELLVPISIKATTAFIVIRDNSFTARGGPVPATIFWPTPVAIRVVDSAHVAIERNTLRNVNPFGDSVRIVGSHDISVIGNTGVATGSIRVQASDVIVASNEWVDRGLQVEDSHVFVHHNKFFDVGARNSWGLVTANELNSTWARGALPAGYVFSGNNVSDGANFEQFTSNISVTSNSFGGDVWLVGPVRMTSNTINNCEWCIYFPERSNLATLEANVVNGRPTIFIKNQDGVEITSVEPIGWLGVVGSTNVVIHNFTLAAPAFTALIGVTNLTIRDATLPGKMRAIFTGSVIAERVHLGTVEFDGFYANVTSFTARDIVATEMGVGIYNFSRTEAPVIIERGTFNRMGVFSEKCAPFAIKNVTFIGESAMLVINRWCPDVTKTILRDVSFAPTTIFYADSGPIDATHNWWGSPDGPVVNHEPFDGRAAIAGAAAGSVLYAPWLATAP